MAELTGKTIALTYKSLLNVAGNDGVLAAGGSAALQVKTSGASGDTTPLYLNTDRVGIGTASPAALLDIYSTATTNPTFRVVRNQASGSTDSPMVYLTNTNTGDDQNALKVNNDGTGDCASFLNDSVEIMVIGYAGAGNVGIGIAAPTAKLHVTHGTTGEWAGQFVQTHAGGYGVLIDVEDAATDPAFKITSGSTVCLNVDGNGKVGIGTASPGSLLHLKDTSTTNSECKFVMDGADSLITLINATNAWSFGADNAPDRFVIADGTSLASGERLVILASGNVGIGTAEPGKKLHVLGTTDTVVQIENDDDTAYVAIASTVPYATAQLTIQNIGDGTEDGHFAGIGFNIDSANGSGGTSAARAFFGAIQPDNTNDDTDFVFKLRKHGALPVEMMRINSDGYVGIGTTTPGYQLHVKKVNAAASFALQRYDSSISDNDTIGNIMFLGDEDNATDVVARIKVAADEDWNSNDQPTYMSFWTCPDGAYAATEKMRIDATGNVGIGETVPLGKLHIQSASGSAASINSSGDELVLENSGNCGMTIWSGGTTSEANIYFADSTSSTYERIHCLHSGTADNTYIKILTQNISRLVVRGNGDVTPGVNNTQSFGTDALEWATLWATNTTVQSSDERLKKNIQDLSDSGLAKINALKPRTFDWKKRKEVTVDGDGAETTSITHKGDGAIGFIAQEVQSIVPEAVAEGGGDIDFLDEAGNILIAKGDKSLGLGMSGSAMIAYLVKAIQELSAKVTALENA